MTPHSSVSVLDSSGSSGAVSVTVVLDLEVVEWLDRLKRDLGAKTRGSLINKILRELSGLDGDASVDSAENDSLN